MTAEQFLQRLEQDRLVKADVLASLRGQVQKSAKPVAAATIAKLLVDKGILTAQQSQSLLTAAPAATAQPAKLSDPLDDLLGFAPLDDDPAPNPTPAAKPAAAAQPAAQKPKPTASAPVKKSAAAPAAKAAAPSAAIDGLQALNDLQPLDDLQPLGDLQSLDGLDPLDDAGFGSAVVPLDEPLAQASSPASPQPLDDLSAGGDLFGASLGDPLAQPASPQPGAARRGSKASTAVASAGIPAGATVITAQSAAGPAKPRSALMPSILFLVFSLIVLGTVVGIMLIPKPTGDAEFAAAEGDYQAKQYASAVPKYAAFVERFDYHPQIGAARVHHAWSRIQEVAGGSRRDWPAILPVAKDALGQLGSAPQVSELHAELAPLLTDMAAAFADEARKAKDPAAAAEQLAAAKDALALANDSRFVPGNLRDWQRLAEIEDSLAMVGHESARPAALDTATAAMKQALVAKNLVAVYAEREKLLARYPAAASEASLVELMQQAAAAEAGRVENATEPGQLATAAPAPVIEVLAAAPAAAEPVAAFSIGGAVWAVDSASGKPLWRAPGLGYLPAAPLPGGDVLLVDVQRNELIRVNGASGAIAWRFAANSPIESAPLVAGQQVVIATREGTVIALDAGSGAVAAAAKLPQGVLATPAYDEASGNLYVVAQAHHAYVLTLADLTCKSAAYLGHEAGMDVAPIVAGGRLYAVENRGQAAVLYVLAMGGDGSLQGSLQQERLQGVVASPPVVLGSRVVAVTDKMAILFELPSSNTGRLRRAGELPSGDGAQASARYGLAIGDRLWIGGAGLRQYGPGGAGELFAPISASFPDSTIVAPPQVVGAAVIAVRQDAGKPATAFALQAADVKSLWESPLTLPANKAAQP